MTQTSENTVERRNDLIHFIDYSFAVLCSNCGGKVLDPDKKKNQLVLNGKCPSCGENSSAPKIEQKKSKKERRRERRDAKLRARGKYNG